MKKKEKFDPISVEIIQSSISAIADEMFAAMQKTAMSSIIYEILDFGVAITDKNGNLAGSGAGIPVFVGMLDHAVKSIIKKFQDSGKIKSGDIFISNIPQRGGVSHLNDITLILPIFVDDEIVAWVANKAHWSDVGGMSPGSMDPNATEIYQEGIQLPEVKLFENNLPVESVMDIIMANIRLTDTAQGDLWAGISSMKVGEERIIELVEKYDKETVLYAIDKFMDYGEKVSLKALEHLPKGTFSAKAKLDDDQELKAKITITDKNFIVDLRDNPSQNSGPINNSFEATKVEAQTIFKAVTSPQTPANAGSFRPLKVICDEGSMFNAEYPAAMGYYSEAGIIVFDLLKKVLAPHLPDKLPAGNFASICGTIIGGIHPETQKPYNFVEPELGGWGGGLNYDGNSAHYTGTHGETYNTPVEINERRNGVRVERYELSDEPGGDGKFRGGKGIKIDHHIIAENAWITALYTHSKYPAWGVNGGHDGSVNFFKIKRKNGEEEIYSSCSVLPLEPGDIVQITTANGGGYGDPKERPADKVKEDLKNEYITEEQAHEIYGLE